ncbi:MAG: hypothetical protein RL292_543 [Candidatus Parcubacteria bacterium]|jgi:ribosome-binding protein aMBF1 (putative translation factor)
MSKVTNPRKVLGALIRTVRQGKGIKPEEFAQSCQIDEHIFHRIERGKGNYRSALVKDVIAGLEVREQVVQAELTRYFNKIYHPCRWRLGPVFRKSF